MSLRNTLTPIFVEHVPESLEEGTIYISMQFATAIHQCCCGCGREVVTPLAPAKWRLMFDGESVSFSPSIGNWSFPCQSHYWIQRNLVVCAPKWSREEILEGRSSGSRADEEYFESKKPKVNSAPTEESKGRPKRGFLTKVKKLLFPQQ